jgi:hypothetical protein
VNRSSRRFDYHSGAWHSTQTSPCFDSKPVWAA